MKQESSEIHRRSGWGTDNGRTWRKHGQARWMKRIEKMLLLLFSICIFVIESALYGMGIPSVPTTNLTHVE